MLDELRPGKASAFPQRAESPSLAHSGRVTSNRILKEVQDPPAGLVILWMVLVFPDDGLFAHHRC